MDTLLEGYPLGERPGLVLLQGSQDGLTIDRDPGTLAGIHRKTVLAVRRGFPFTHGRKGMGRSVGGYGIEGRRRILGLDHTAPETQPIEIDHPAPRPLGDGLELEEFPG